MKIDQDKFFEGTGLQRCDFDGIICYLGSDGCYYRIDHFANTYVIEYIEDEAYAKLGSFDDADRFDDDLPEEELIRQVKEAVLSYVNDKD